MPTSVDCYSFDDASVGCLVDTEQILSLIGLLNRGCRIWCNPVIRRIPVATMHLWCRGPYLYYCLYSAAIQSLCWQLLGLNALIVHLGSLHSLWCVFSSSVSDWWSVAKLYGLPLMRFVSIHTLLAVEPMKSHLFILSYLRRQRRTIALWSKG